MDNFTKNQWDLFCENLKRSAIHLAGEDGELKSQFDAEADKFIAGHSPSSYQELLEVIATGTDLAVKWQMQSPVKQEAGSASEHAYSSSENHEPMPLPTDTMAEQAEQSKSSN